MGRVPIALTTTACEVGETVPFAVIAELVIVSGLLFTSAWLELNGVKACRAVKLLDNGSLLILLVAECGLVDLVEPTAMLVPFSVDARVKGVCSPITLLIAGFSGAQIEGDGGVGVGSKLDPLVLVSLPTSLSVGDGRSLKKNPLGEKGLLIGL